MSRGGACTMTMGGVMYAAAVRWTIGALPSSDVRPKADRAKDHGCDKDFIATPKLPDGAGEAFANNDAAILNAPALAFIFEAPMGAPVETGR
jgi:hypothetical protein